VWWVTGRFTPLRTLVEDDIDVYLVRAGCETFERPIHGSPKDWKLAEPSRKATYVKLSQVVSFAPEFQGTLTYIDSLRGVMVGVPAGYGVMKLLPEREMKALKDAFYTDRKR